MCVLLAHTTICVPARKLPHVRQHVHTLARDILALQHRLQQQVSAAAIPVFIYIPRTATPPATTGLQPRLQKQESCMLLRYVSAAAIPVFIHIFFHAFRNFLALLAYAWLTLLTELASRDRPALQHRRNRCNNASAGE